MAWSGVGSFLTGGSRFSVGGPAGGGYGGGFGRGSTLRPPGGYGPGGTSHGFGPMEGWGGGSGQGIGSRLLGWIGKNPEVPLAVLGTAANVYGAHQEGKAEDRRIRLQEEEQRRRWEWEDRERRRREAAYRGIVERRQGGGG